ncbi:MAG: DedA family protein [Patescibacteria group bacterium]
MLEYFVVNYGYIALFAGSLIEGELVLIVAGFLAHLGLFNLPWVIAVALVGTIVGDQFYFYLGRRRGRQFLEKRPKWQARLEKTQTLLDKHQNWILVGFRFLYQFRAIIPFAFGLSPMKAEKFLIWNASGALIWAILWAGGGYFFGNTLAALFTDFKRFQTEAIYGIIILALLIWLVYFLWKKLKFKKYV